MDIDEMRRRFREQKAQAQTVETIQETVVSTVEVVNSTETPSQEENNLPAKSGDLSSVEMNDVTYEYEKGSNKVNFICSSIENKSEEPTGHLILACYISEKKRKYDGWLNDNHANFDYASIGSMPIGDALTNINHTFEIPEEFTNFIQTSESEWYFVFTIEEYHDDGEFYIIEYNNGTNEGETIHDCITDESITILTTREEDSSTIVCKDGVTFDGCLWSSDYRRMAYVISGTELAIYYYFDNDKIAFEINHDGQTFYNKEGREISQDAFTKIFGNEFVDIASKFEDEKKSKFVYIDDDEEEDDEEDLDYDDVYEKVKEIIVDKLNVKPYKVNEDATFVNDLGADSLDVIELTMEFEKEFGVMIPDEDIENITTVEEAVDYIYFRI